MFLGLSKPIDIFWHFRFSREVWQLFSQKGSIKVYVITFTPRAPVCLEVAFLCSNTLNDTALRCPKHCWSLSSGMIFRLSSFVPEYCFFLSLSSVAWTKQLWLELLRLMKVDAFSMIQKRIYTCCRKCSRLSEYFARRYLSRGCILPSILNMLVRQGYVWQIPIRHMNVPTERI